MKVLISLGVLICDSLVCFISMVWLVLKLIEKVGVFMLNISRLYFSRCCRILVWLVLLGMGLKL